MRRMTHLTSEEAKFRKEDVHRLGVVMLRKGAWKEWLPSLNIEHYSGPNQNIGPVSLVFDLHHQENPKLSKPFAQAHLTPSQNIQLIANLVRAQRQMFPLRSVDEILEEVRMEIPKAAEDHRRQCPLCGRIIGDEWKRE